MFSVVLVQGRSLRHPDKCDQCQISSMDLASPRRSVPVFSLLILVRTTRGVTNTEHSSLEKKVEKLLRKTIKKANWDFKVVI